MFLGFAWFKLELGNSRGKSGLAGYREIANQVTPGATPDQTSTDHANGLLSFVVDSDVLLHAYLKMTDMLDGRRCSALDSCG